MARSSSGQPIDRNAGYAFVIERVGLSKLDTTKTLLRRGVSSLGWAAHDSAQTMVCSHAGLQGGLLSPSFAQPILLVWTEPEQRADRARAARQARPVPGAP